MDSVDVSIGQVVFRTDGNDAPAPAQAPSNDKPWYGLAEDWVSNNVIDPAKAAINRGETKFEQITGAGGDADFGLYYYDGGFHTNPVGTIRKDANGKPIYTTEDLKSDLARADYAKSDSFIEQGKLASDLQNLPSTVKNALPNSTQLQTMLGYAAIVAAVLGGVYVLSLASSFVPRRA